MASKHGPERPLPSPPAREDVTSDDGREAESDSDESAHDSDTQQEQDSNTQQQQDPERPKSPAYVAPIPKIGSISPVSPGIQISPADRPKFPPYVGKLLLEGVVDDDGDIVHEITGQVLARAAGDLPSIVGRKVSNPEGDILGDNGELLGYVADVDLGSKALPSGPPRSLFDLMGRATSSLMVDGQGNILDSDGKVVGTFLDNNNPLHRKEKEDREARERARQKGEPVSAAPKTDTPQEEQQEQKEQQQQRSPPPPQQEEESQSTGDGQRKPRRTEEERRENAEAWRKEKPDESPSDIFLDVKSTREGIQLTIRIPTVFNGQQTTPKISFS